MSIDGILKLDAVSECWRLDDRIWEPPADLYAVIGDPVAHSRSPLMHNAAFAATGIAASYMRLALARDQVPLLKARGHDLGLRGFSVTMPFKEPVSALCDDLTPEAVAAGAVNAVRVDGGRWTGHNTDIAGIRETLKRHLTAGSSGLVFGAGGSARAAVVALSRMGAHPLTVVSRPGATDAAFRAWVSTAGQDVDVLTWGKVPDAAPTDSLLVVACVPAGVVVGDLLPQGIVHGAFLDLRYGGQHPERIESGAWTSYDGEPVLVDQGAAAFQWWFSLSAPRAIMLAALTDS